MKGQWLEAKTSRSVMTYRSHELSSVLRLQRVFMAKRRPLESSLTRQTSPKLPRPNFLKGKKSLGFLASFGIEQLSIQTVFSLGLFTMFMMSLSFEAMTVVTISFFEAFLEILAENFLSTDFLTLSVDFAGCGCKILRPSYFLRIGAAAEALVTFREPALEEFSAILSLFFSFKTSQVSYTFLANTRNSWLLLFDLALLTLGVIFLAMGGLGDFTVLIGLFIGTVGATISPVLDKGGGDFIRSVTYPAFLYFFQSRLLSFSIDF